MRHSFQFAAVFLLIAGTTGMRAQIHITRNQAHTEDLSWMWQYTKPSPDGDENGLIGDARFKDFLKRHLTAPQSFWGGDGEPLADVAMEFLGVPGIARAEDNRYITATGCVPHFCPARGMLFVDTAGSRPLVVFAAIDWNREGHALTENDAEYTLWIFSNRSFGSQEEGSSTPHLPPSLQRSVGVFSAALNGGAIAPLVTRAFIVDPSGTPHEISPSLTGATRFHDLQPLAPSA